MALEPALWGLVSDGPGAITLGLVSDGPGAITLGLVSHGPGASAPGPREPRPRSLSLAATEALCLEPVLCSKRSRHSEKPALQWRHPYSLHQHLSHLWS